MTRSYRDDVRAKPQVEEEGTCPKCGAKLPDSNEPCPICTSAEEAPKE